MQRAANGYLSPIKRAIRTNEEPLDTYYGIFLSRSRPRFRNSFWFRIGRGKVKEPEFLHVWSRKSWEFFKCSPANVILKKAKKSRHTRNDPKELLCATMCRTSWSLSAECLCRALLPFNHSICRNGCAFVCYHGPWCPAGIACCTTWPRQRSSRKRLRER